MTFASARLLLVIAGVVLPYAARLPFGLEWVRQYTDVGLGGWLLLGGFNAIAWSALLGISFLYRRPIALLVPCLIGFGCSPGRMRPSIYAPMHSRHWR